MQTQKRFGLKINHRVGRSIFALAIGLLVAFGAYKWASNPAGRQERSLQESVVVKTRDILRSNIGSETLEIVDPLSPDRKVGKAYVYREDGGWAVSGYYRRTESDRWHPYLMTLDADLILRLLKMRDSEPALLQRAATEQALEVTR